MFCAGLALATLPACSLSTNLDSVTDSGVAHPIDSGGVDAGDVGQYREAAGKDAAETDAGFKDGGKEGSAPDGEAGSDAAPPAPVGTTLDTGPGIVIQGVTDDGYVVYVTPTSISAVPVTGGTPTVLIKAPGGTSSGGVLVDFAYVAHDVVFLFSNTAAMVANLSVWTSALGAPVAVSKIASTAVAPAASSDSTEIAYATNPDGTLSIVGASMAALTSPIKLASGLDSGTGGCFPSMGFTGQASPFYLVASYCIAGPSETDGPNLASSFPTTTWAPIELATGVTALSLDAVGTLVAVGITGGQLETIPVAGGSALPIDADGTLASYPSIYLSQTDGFVLYVNAATEGLMRSPVATSAPEALSVCFSSNCVEGLVGDFGLATAPSVSPDENWALAYPAIVSLSADVAFPSGVTLVSTSEATDSWNLTGTSANPSSVAGDAFTVDSRYGIFMQAITVDGAGRATGELDVVSTAAPVTVTKLTSSGYFSVFGSPADLVLSGTQVSYVDNFSYGDLAVDLHSVDLATTTTPTTLMRRINPDYAVSADKTTIVYAVTLGGATDGLYAVAP
jgi:hypothetical protein